MHNDIHKNNHCCCGHEHSHEHITDKNNILAKIILSGIFFVGGFVFKPLYIVAYFIIGYDIILTACKNIVKGEIFDENFLMTIATLGAICIKEFPEAVAVMFLYQIGEYLQDKATKKSKKSISDLMNIKPEFVNIIDEFNNIKKIDPKDAKIGDIAIVNSGEKIPLDGTVIEGSSNVNTSSITGESIPQEVTIGDKLISGCINLDGVLKFRVEKEYGNSTVSKILELVEHSQDKKTKTEKFITKFAKIYTPIVVLCAILFVIVGIFVLNLQLTEAFRRALTFLVISCPCALVISIPLSFFAGIGKASSEGILIKGSSYIETLTKVRDVVLDKTGTLTKGKFEVSEINSENPDILKLVAYAEFASNHPIALAIKEKFGEEIPQNTEIKEVAGGGVIANVDGNEVKAGNARFIGIEPIKKDGTVVYVSLNGDYIGNIVVNDTIKENSKMAIENLKNFNIKTTMLTGDSKNIALSVQKTLNIDDVYYEQTPQDKVNNLEKIINNSQGKVLFAGDGVNDAPVIMRADVGVSMGNLGADSAIEASDVVIMNDNPQSIARAIQISKKTLNIAKQNITLAIGVKALFLLLSTFGLMTMWGAVFADVGVTILAVLNALRIIRIKEI
jgi:Cd2+/Zn2+-exporting ATPase